MELKEKIRLYNVGEYGLVTELMKLTNTRNLFKTTMKSHKITLPHYNIDTEEPTTTYTRWRPEYTLGENDTERLVRNFVIWTYKFTKLANKRYSLTPNKPTQNELLDYDPIGHIYEVFTSLGHHYFIDDFDLVPQSVWDDIEKAHGFDVMDDLKSEFDVYAECLPEIQREKARLTKQYHYHLENALHTILPKVDLDRTPEQIIGFIAVSTKRELEYHLTRELNKVHNIDGKKYNVNNFNQKFKNVNIESLLGVLSHKLSANQYAFFDTLRKAIRVELDNKNRDIFTFNEEGNIIDYNRRYFAEQLGFEESAFKHRVRRMVKKSDM